MKKIAIIGTGIMGTGMASNFLKNNYEVIVWNRSKDSNFLKSLLQKGAKLAASPKHAVELADIIFEVTANDKSSKSVWYGRNGILEGANNEKILITSATLSVPWTDELAAICKSKKLTFLDMPLTGGRMGAESGNLVLLVGGDEKKLDLIKKELGAISAQIIYFGKAGSGMRYKLLLNMLQGIHINALGEVLSLAKEMGMDIKKVGDALAERPGGTTTNLAWRDYQNEPKPINFSVEWITKDLGYAKKAAKKTKTPLLDKALNKYRKIMKKGHGQKDWSYVNKIN